MIKDYSKERLAEIEKKLFKGMVDLCSSIVKEAQQNAKQTPPKHPQVQSGTMWRSITLDVQKTGDSVEGRVGIMADKGGGKAREYAPWIEFGTSRMPPYPFLYPAVETHKSKIKEFFQRWLEVDIA